MAGFDYDVLIIGSGFGGSVAALRAAEKGYRVGVMESGPTLAGREDPEEPVGPGALHLVSRRGALRSPEDRVPRRRAGSLRRRCRRRLACVCEHDVRPTEAVLRREGMGRHHRLGRRAGAVLRPGQEDARRRPLPVHAHGRRPGHPAGRERHRPRGDPQQGPTRRLFRHAGSRGRRSVLRRGRAAAHRLHLLRQLQQRLRPQRQEQADDELPLPRREARRAGSRHA